VKTYRVIVTFVSIVWLAGCSSIAERDAKDALARGDNRLVGYMGLGLIIPETPPGFQAEKCQAGIRVLPRITDTSDISDIDNAACYASRYNRVILGVKR
jgi:hypothetical protein